ncbi:YbhB/YbcL family Raf kinase inhibitor-like protein [Candidatus Micrarchaeota archaeon]|nr:YbhB/YbcL family Raf kinase inhibitor-like protein [Candidatus Micrarchaeota archaeon]
MELTSTAFRNGGKIPRKYTCEGEDINPDLTIVDPPPRTQSFALIVDDPDAPMGTWVHWVVWNIPAQITEIRESETLGERGVNDFKNLGYGGPCPPPGDPHTYRFKLYALDMELKLEKGATRQELEKAMEGHILDQAELDGEFQR